MSTEKKNTKRPDRDARPVSGRKTSTKSSSGRIGIVNEQTERLGKELGLVARIPPKREPSIPLSVKKKAAAAAAKSDSTKTKIEKSTKAVVRKTEKTKTAEPVKVSKTAKPKTPVIPKPQKTEPVIGRKTEKQPIERKKIENLKIIPIGGLDEIGKNLTILEYEDQILVIDCGMSFPEDEMFGIDLVIPDLTYLITNAKKIKGVIITHGHEDHIGGIPYLLKQIDVPIYGTALSLGLIKNKLEENGLKGKLHQIKAGDVFRLGSFEIEAYRTTHSIADALCYCVKTPAATLFHTGDFKIDYTPVDGEPIDFAALARVGERGVDILLADSTNATREGYTPSERLVGETLDDIFRDVRNRIIIATFSSNVHRVQKIIDLSIKFGRKIAISGRSMEKVVKLASDLGYLKFPGNSYVELSEIKNIPDDELTIITTGSQGEPMSALARMSDGIHHDIKLKKGDTVILSSTPVPGNEKSVSRIVNKLYEREINVIYNEVADIHVSGHASREDLRLMHSLIKPKFFMPVHGEHRHLVQHAELARELGMRRDNIFILANGDQLTVDKKRAIKFKNIVPAEDVMIDSFDLGDIGAVVMKDRIQLSEAGLILVVAGVDKATGSLVSGPELLSRGFVYVKESEELMNEAKEIATETIEKNLKMGFRDWNSLKNDTRDALRKFIFTKTRKSPVILTVFLEV